MSIDIDVFRARVGCFHARALSAFRRLAFLNLSTVLPFLILSISNSPRRLVVAVFVFHLLYPASGDTRVWFANRSSKSPTKCNSTRDCTKKTYSTENIKYNLLTTNGNVEKNPGPQTESDLRVMHVNTRSLKNKLDLFEAESSKFEIITVSETWLSPTPACDNKYLGLTNYHPPIRKDRPINDPWGGVAIYVKNDLYCKHRKDLDVNDLEAVWVETKLKQESILIGSFYRPPGVTVQYWDLIREGIRKASNTMLKFIILGDFNTNYLHNPSQHLLDIANHYQLHQTVKQATRITDKTSTCLDLIFTQNPNIIKSTEVLPPF